MDDVLDVDNSKDKLNWSTKEEEYLITLMVEEVKKGSLNSTNFQKRTWTIIANKLQTKFDKVYTLAKLKQKFNRLRTKWKLFKELIGSNYMMSRQGSIVIACCVLHNFIRMFAADDPWFERWDIENVSPNNDETVEATLSGDIPDVMYYMSQQQLNEMAVVRDNIAEQLWNNVN